MKRISINLVLTIIAMVIIFPCQNISHAQIRGSQKPESRNANKKVSTFEIKHAAMEQAQEVLEAVLAGDDSHLVADVEARQFILIGSDKSTQLAVEAISKIDQKRQAKPVAPHRLFQLANISAKQAMEIVDGLFRDRSLRLTFDSRTNAIIASSTEERLDEIGALINLLDAKSESGPAKTESSTSTKDCELRISWLVDSSSFPEADQTLLRKVRPSLQKLAAKLKSDSGVAEIATLTDVQTLTSNGQFQNTSLRQLNSGDVEIIAQGSAQRTEEGKFDLSLELRFTASDQGINLQSRFSAPANHPVAFSISDIGGIRSYLVVEVASSTK